jgi:uncharacterized membrane protein YfcA
MMKLMDAEIVTKNSLMIPQGAVAGFLDAIGGGGWGPVNTPLLLAQKKLEQKVQQSNHQYLVQSLTPS